MSSALFFTFHPFIDEQVKAASAESHPLPPIDKSARAECDQILRKIYDENPKFWPYGLEAGMMDGGVYMVRKASTNEAVGFTGWQQRKVGGKKVGFYAIGILPEHRHQGLAKAAVLQLLQEKAADVDEVRAFIVPGNQPSLALAQSLDIPVMHKAAGVGRKILEFIQRNPRGVGAGVGAAGTAAVLDYRAHPDDGFLQGHWDRGRVVDGVVNAGVGALGGSLIGRGVAANEPLATTAGAGTILTAPAKDVLLAARPTLDTVNSAAKNQLGLNALKSPALIGLLTAGGLGLGGYLMAKARPKDTGKMRLRLPRADGRDTEIEMPLPEGIPLPQKLVDSLRRDTRDNLRRGAADRKRHVSDGRLRLNPKLDKDGDGEIDPPKFASIIPQQGAAQPPQKPPVAPQMNGSGKLTAPTQFSNSASSAMDKVKANRAQVQANQQALGAQSQEQQNQDRQFQLEQQRLQMDQATAAATPTAASPSPEFKPSGALSASVSSTLAKVKMALKPMKMAAENPYAPKPIIPTAAPAKPATPQATPTPPPAAAPAPASPRDPARQRLLSFGIQPANIQETSGGIVGTKPSGGRYFIDDAGRSHVYLPGVESDPGANFYNSLGDWAHGRPGSTLAESSKWYNPSTWFEGIGRKWMRGGLGMGEGYDKMRGGDVRGGLGDMTSGLRDSLSAGADLGTYAVGGGAGGALKTTLAGAGKAMGLQSLSNLIDPDSATPYRDFGTQDIDNILEGPGGRRPAPRANTPVGDTEDDRFSYELARANRFQAPWANSMQDNSPYSRYADQVTGMAGSADRGDYGMLPSLLMQLLKGGYGNVNHAAVTGTN